MAAPGELCERAMRLYRESDPNSVIRRLAEQLGVPSGGVAELDPPEQGRQVAAPTAGFQDSDQRRTPRYL
jgi:hypothetical protein